MRREVNISVIRFLSLSRSHSYQIGTAFEVHVRTQSLCTSEEDSGCGPSSVGTSSSSSSSTVTNLTATSLPATSTTIPELITPGNQRNLLWATKEAGACVLTALLLRLELVN